MIWLWCHFVIILNVLWFTFYISSVQCPFIRDGRYLLLMKDNGLGFVDVCTFALQSYINIKYCVPNIKYVNSWCELFLFLNFSFLLSLHYIVKQSWQNINWIYVFNIELFRSVKKMFLNLNSWFKDNSFQYQFMD